MRRNNFTLISFINLRIIKILFQMSHPITLEEERKVWTIHQSVNGLTYYYNRATKKSQYQMPQCFKTTEEALEHPEWKEYRTAEGKKFYYNASTRRSCWQLPNEVKQYRIKLEEKKKKDREENGGKDPEEEKLSEGEEIKKKYMQLLRAKSVNMNTKWDSCIKLCEDDPRWQLLKISDKKKYYNQYIAELKKITEMEKKAKTQVNKAQFLKMLKENKNLTSESKMHKVAYDFLTDTRWRILEQNQKEITFQNYLDELSHKEKEQARQKKLQYCQMLKSCLEEENIKCTTRWDDIRSLYKNNPYYKELHPYDRISTFVQYILEAEKKNDEEVAKEKRLKERSNRVNFREMLRQNLLSGNLTYKSKWKSFIADHKDDKNLLNMMDPEQKGSTAHEIFENFLEDIRENHKLIKTQIKHHFKKNSFRMIQETSNQEFKDKLSDLPLFVELKPIVKDYFHKYFQQKIRSKNQNKQLSAKKNLKKERKVIFKIFRQLKDNFKSKYSIEEHMEKIEKGMKEYGINITHQSIFKYYLAFLQGHQDDHKKQASHSPSRSNSNSSASSKKKKMKKKQKEETETHKFTLPIVEKSKDAMEVEEEGQIKDDSADEKEKKKKNKSKKKKKGSSSDSD